MARRIHIDDSRWDEVRFINGYAVFMGYLLMGVRGLALLVVTWSTAVLLGGFVDNLERKDFWSLTLVTLIKTIRVSDFIIPETLRNVINSGWGLLAAIASVIIHDPSKTEKPSNARWTLAYGVFAVQLLVFAFLLCPLAILYVFGLFISAGISLWRLIDHDFGSIKEDSNLKPALEVLYSLAVAQGILFGYRFIYYHGAKRRIAKEVGRWYQLDQEIVLDYLSEMVRGCEKDPSFARGRNLVTYAADLTMKPNSRKSFLSGVLILGALLRPKHRWYGQAGVIKQVLTGSASFSHVVRQLLETFGPTSPYSSEIKEEAARIVELVARSIRLEQFPGVAIHCVSSLLDTFDEYIWRPEEEYERKVDIPKEFDRDWLFEEYDKDYLAIDGVPRPKAAEGESPESDRHRLLHGYKALVVVGLRILQKLAVHADNCMIISSTEGLVLKTMAHLTSGHLHGDRHDEWCGIAVESLKLMTGLMAAPGETGTKLRHQISGSMEAVISTSESVMDCPDCNLLLKRQTVQVLLDMSVDTSSIIAANESRKVIFTWILLHIFLLPDRERCGSIHLAKKGSYIRKLAGGKLQSVLSLQSEGSETRMLQSLGAVAGDLVSRTIVDAIDNSHILDAVLILIDLCRRYTERGVFLEGLKNGITNVLPKILQEIIGCGSTSEEIQVVTEENNDQVWAAPGADIEKGDVSQGRGQENASSQQQNGNEQPEDSKVQEALISLCMVIIENWIGKDQDVTRRFDNITSRLCSEQGMPVKTFAPLVTEVRDKLLKEKKMLKDW